VCDRQTDRKRVVKIIQTEDNEREKKHKEQQSDKYIDKHCYSKHFLISRTRTNINQITAVTFRTQESLDSAASEIYLKCLTSPI
jgi:hypothetical protein